MTYSMIREELPYGEKLTSVFHFSRFSVCKSDLAGEILVDRDVAEKIQNRKWCLSEGYPASRIGGEVIRLHDVVMALSHEEKPDGCFVDHVNQDKLDNRRCNLRFVTPAESSKNIPLSTLNTSGYVGVSHAKKGRFRAYITVNKKRIALGTYDTLEEAASARREAENRLGFKTRPGTIRQKLDIVKAWAEANKKEE